VLKGKNLPNVIPLVDANFIAEVETFVLTAGHDVAKLREPISIDVSREGDQMTQMNGASKVIRAGDMVMKDAEGISCSIIYGQDNRSPISADTTHVLYVTYAPAGVPAEIVDSQLRKIEENIRLFSPNVIVEQHRLLRA
jgi:DNA/RNA-binding domain of Phe-tRNA-synthetase-like protein